MNAPQRLLVVETLYLGDLIHALPLVQALRARFPAARLEVLVRAAHAPLMAQVAAIDETLVMDPAQHRRPGGLLRLVGQLRQRRYDLVLNPGASDRATILTWLSGGAQRIGRLNRNGSRRLWPWLHDVVVSRPWGAEPMHVQKLAAFRDALQLPAVPGFGLARPPRLAARAAPYLHLSPCASEDIRSLPPATVVALLQGLRRRHPALELVVSGGPSVRERERLAVIREGLDDPAVVFLPGTLGLVELAALIGHAVLHLGPDSGPLHLARALDTPAVACFLFKDASAEWMPVGARYRTLGVTQRFEGGLYGLPVAAVLDAVDEILSS
jgi:ADP-heptose:LPS heptosyltransferase